MSSANREKLERAGRQIAKQAQEWERAKRQMVEQAQELVRLGRLTTEDNNAATAMVRLGRQIAEQHKAATAEAEILMREIPELSIQAGDEYLREHPPSALAICILTELAAAQARSTSASNAAAAKNAAQKKWLRDEWTKEGLYYKNRRDFVRIKYKIMSQLFDVKVGEDQVYREWLKPSK